MMERKAKRNYWDKYVFKSTGVSYRKVLPQEKWPIIENFIAYLVWAARAAKEAGEPFNATKVLKECRKGRGSCARMPWL